MEVFTNELKSNQEIQNLDKEVQLLILDVAKEHSRRSSSNNNNSCMHATHDDLLCAITRAEALEVCHGQTTLDVDVLRRLKISTTVIQETLRLYPAASLILREALTDIKLGGLNVPRGTIIQVAIAMLHLNKDVWGPDADEFRPDRFANGAGAACKPAHMYLPFGHGPRMCAGQNLTMVELKAVVVRLLSKFAFSPSPRYDMPLVVTRLP